MDFCRRNGSAIIRRVPMAMINWHKKAYRLFMDYVATASVEFGKSTAQRWQKEKKGIEWRLERYPTSYPPEKFLRGREHLYRQCHLMNRRFKIIYFYDEAEDIIHIMDIWDTRMNPTALVRRIK